MSLNVFSSQNMKRKILALQVKLPDCFANNFVDDKHKFEKKKLALFSKAV